MPPATNLVNHRVRATDIALPPLMVSANHDQDQEWCVVDVDGQWRKIRFHDYDEIYSIPGLYETLFYDVLNCRSPAKIREMLRRCLHASRFAPEDLRALDLGAGNGMVGEELAGLGARRIVGVDITPAAAMAARRDRREVYEDYLVLDMTSLSDRDMAQLSAFEFNCLTCVAALGFGDIPAAAFASAYNLIGQGGWVAFNIKSNFLEPDDAGGFAGLIRRMIDSRLIDLRLQEQYPHRLSASGKPLLYTGLIGVKNGDIPTTWQI
jgi:hypothetical protein